MSATAGGLPGAPTVQILMAAYQGARFVRAQVESIIAQTWESWRLVVQDDCSTDGTWEILQQLAAEHPDRITLRRNERNSGSAAANFLSLLTASDGAYVACCDDDDVWEPTKLEVTMAEMLRIEAEVGQSTPVLVHTDLAVVDEELRPLAPSLMRRQRLQGRESRLPRLLVQNSVTGCTVVANRALVSLVPATTADVAMHDWWLALLAAATGRIGFVDQPTVRYRQHGGNAVGAKASQSVGYLARRAVAGTAVTSAVAASRAQAAAFDAVMGDRLTGRDAAAVRAMATMSGLSKPARVAALIRHGLWKGTVIRRIGQLVYS